MLLPRHNINNNSVRCHHPIYPVEDLVLRAVAVYNRLIVRVHDNSSSKHHHRIIHHIIHPTLTHIPIEEIIPTVHIQHNIPSNHPPGVIIVDCTIIMSRRGRMIIPSVRMKYWHTMDRPRRLGNGMRLVRWLTFLACNKKPT